jgi:hypothetical protein
MLAWQRVSAKPADRASNGSGVMVIFDVPDPAMAPAVCGVAVSAGSIQNVEMTRLFTMEEIADIRQRRGRYTAPTSRLVSSNRLGGGRPTASDFALHAGGPPACGIAGLAGGGTGGPASAKGSSRTLPSEGTLAGEPVIGRGRRT